MTTDPSSSLNPMFPLAPDCDTIPIPCSLVAHHVQEMNAEHEDLPGQCSPDDVNSVEGQPRIDSATDAATICPWHGLDDRELVTTLMIRYTGRKMGHEDALRLWPYPEYRYHLIYVPFDRVKRRASGYTFVNFEMPEHAVAFYRRWHGQHIPSAFQGGARPLEIEVAERQGFDNIIIHVSQELRNKAMELPVIFVGGRRKDFWSFIHELEHVHAQKASPTGIFPDLLCL